MRAKVSKTMEVMPSEWLLCKEASATSDNLKHSKIKLGQQLNVKQHQLWKPMKSCRNSNLSQNFAGWATGVLITTCIWVIKAFTFFPCYCGTMQIKAAGGESVSSWLISLISHDHIHLPGALSSTNSTLSTSLCVKHAGYKQQQRDSTVIFKNSNAEFEWCWWHRHKYRVKRTVHTRTHSYFSLY